MSDKMREALEELMRDTLDLAFVRHNIGVPEDEEFNFQEIADDVIGAMFGEGTCSDGPMKSVSALLAAQPATADAHSDRPTWESTHCPFCKVNMADLPKHGSLAKHLDGRCAQNNAIGQPMPTADAIAAERERCAKDVNDLLASISRIRWARGTNKLDEAIRQAIKIQATIDSKKAIRAAPASEPQPASEVPDCPCCQGKKVVDNREG